jgi:hypothetical protein
MYAREPYPDGRGGKRCFAVRVTLNTEGALGAVRAERARPIIPAYRCGRVDVAETDNLWPVDDSHVADRPYGPYALQITHMVGRAVLLAATNVWA